MTYLSILELADAHSQYLAFSILFQAGSLIIERRLLLNMARSINIFMDNRLLSNWIYRKTKDTIGMQQQITNREEESK